MVADCLSDLHAELAGVKFLGSYPASGATSHAIRAEVGESRKRADKWLADLRGEIAAHGT